MNYCTNMSFFAKHSKNNQCTNVLKSFSGVLFCNSRHNIMVDTGSLLSSHILLVIGCCCCMSVYIYRHDDYALMQLIVRRTYQRKPYTGTHKGSNTCRRYTHSVSNQITIHLIAIQCTHAHNLYAFDYHPSLILSLLCPHWSQIIALRVCTRHNRHRKYTFTFTQ
jgi:hypothetical protein